MNPTKMSQQLHIYFFPLLAPSHMLIVVEVARLFARHDPNVKATIVLPHFSVPQFRATIERDRHHGSDINIRQVSFPNARVGVLDESASLDPPRLTSSQLLEDGHPPDCIVSDYFISWTADLASELRVPRIAVHVTGFFPLCVHHNLFKHKPHKGLESLPDTTFVVPGLPDVVRTTYRQLSHYVLDDEEKSSHNNPIMTNAKKAALSSYGVVYNTFKELEPDYVEYYKTNIGSKVWHVGPVSQCNTNTIDKAQRGGGGGGGGGEVLDWLSGRKPNSVVYVCFGTMSSFPAAQINEIAKGLESSGHDFIWVVKGGLEMLPDGFEERIAGRGLIVKSWVPQVLILEHESVGGFLTQCGWSSFMEGVAAGKPMIAWPISSEQFENEKLVTEILKIGAGVGCVEWSERLDVKKILIKGESIAKAVRDVMASVEMKNRVMALSDKAKKAVEPGGSSYNDVDSLLAELRSIKDGKEGCAL